MNVLARDLWSEVRARFQVEHGAAIADLWLPQLQPLSFTRGIFTLGSPTTTVKDWIDERYRHSLEAIFLELTGSKVRVALRVETAVPCVARDHVEIEHDERPNAPCIVRPENRLAGAALARLLADPHTGNPLFLYGPEGVGKSHLVREQLERYARERGGMRTTVSVNAEAFSQRLVRAIKDNELSTFRGSMLAADVFVLEEAHRLRGKPRTQREFLSILRYHIERGRPVILTSRHPPNAIFLLDESLRSYFLAGILVRIPEYADASRVAILESQAKSLKRPIPLETIERIVSRVQGPLPRAMRFVQRVAAYAGLAGRDATLEFVAEKFPELAGKHGVEVDIKALIELTAREFGTTVEDVASNRKVRTAVMARHVVVYVATMVFNMKSNTVMRHLGGLSASTTAYARRRVEEMRREDALFDAKVRQVLDRVQRGQKLLF